MEERVHKECYHKVTYLSRTVLGIFGGTGFVDAEEVEAAAIGVRTSIELEDDQDAGFEMSGRVDPYNLRRFEEAQDGVYERVCAVEGGGEAESLDVVYFSADSRAGKECDGGTVCD